MDTIIFFYKKSDLEKPLMKVREADGYRFLKVGLNITAVQWFGTTVPKPPREAEPNAGRAEQGVGLTAQASEEMPEGGAIGAELCEVGEAERLSGQRRFFIGRRRKERAGRKSFLGKRRKEQAAQKRSFGRHRLEQERIRIEELERMHRRQQYETTVELLERAMQSLMRTAVKGVGELDFCACVYDSGVRKLLLGETPLAVHWSRAWAVPEFSDYREYRWGVELLPYATQSRFVVLGAAPDIPLIVKRCARKMKSLRWILLERDYDEAAQEFIEDFYEDYGLAISVQTVTGRNAFRTLCLESVEPICVMDFTEETGFYFGGLEPGSIWLDFSSREEKAKRMERLAKNVSYCSLKRVWRNENPIKTYFLDSADKSGYNTEVNRLTICDDKGF